MEYLYIKNYLLASREDKLEFFKFLGVFKSFKVIKQKIVLNENSLILEFKENSDILRAKGSIEKFFKGKEHIEVKIIKKIQNKNEFI